MAKKQLIIDELQEDASQGSFKEKEIARDKIEENQEHAPVEKGEESDYELLEEINQ